MVDEVWRGERTAPRELAEQIAGVKSDVLRLPGVEALEVVNISCSAENRDLIVEALRRFGTH